MQFNEVVCSEQLHSDKQEADFLQCLMHAVRTAPSERSQMLSAIKFKWR